MNISEAWEHYYFYTGKISDIVRTSTFAGIAIIWIFRNSNKVGELQLDTQLVLAAVLFMVTLVLDLAQYCAGALKWHSFSRMKDSECSALKSDGTIKNYDDHDFFAPEDINYWAMFFMVTKILPFAFGFFLVITHLFCLWMG